MAGQAGYRASVFVSAYSLGTEVLLRAHRWSVDWKVDDFDSTSFINWGVGQYTGGLTDFDLAFDCLFFQSDNPHSSVVGNDIGAGEFVSIRITFGPAIPIATPNTAPSANNNIPGYFFNRALITHVHTETSVRDIIRFNFAARVSVEDGTDISELTVPGNTANFSGLTSITHSRLPV